MEAGRDLTERRLRQGQYRVMLISSMLLLPQRRLGPLFPRVPCRRPQVSRLQRRRQRLPIASLAPHLLLVAWKAPRVRTAPRTTTRAGWMLTLLSVRLLCLVLSLPLPLASRSMLAPLNRARPHRPHMLVTLLGGRRRFLHHNPSTFVPGSRARRRPTRLRKSPPREHLLRLAPSQRLLPPPGQHRETARSIPL